MCVRRRKYSTGGYFLMWKPSWRGNLEGEVCQGHIRARTGKQKQDGSQADMEHSGPERASTEKVSDSVTVGNHCGISVVPAQTGASNASTKGEERCVFVFNGALVLKAFYDLLKPAHSLIERTYKKPSFSLFNCLL